MNVTTAFRLPATPHRVALACSLCIAALGGLASAPARAVDLPSAGQLLQEVRPVQPLPRTDRPALDVQPSQAPRSDDGTAFRVDRIEITGATRLPQETLRALVASGEGRTHTLGSLYALAERITAAYRAAGYLLDRAYVPAQTLSQGTVRIGVLEATLGTIAVRNQSDVPDDLLKGILAPLQGQAVQQSSLDRGLLLLGDVPGTTSSSVLRPGAEAGTSDLLVDVAPGRAWLASAGLDNTGNRFTGRARANANLTVQNPLKLGDQLTLNALTSGANLRYGRMAYQLPLGSQATRLGAALSAMEYRLGREARGLGSHGSATVASVYGSRTLLRGTDRNLYGQVQFDHRRLRDRVDANNSANDRDLQSLAFSLAGDERSGGGITSGNVAVAAGQVRFRNAAAQALDAAGPDTRGSYAKASVAVTRFQQFTPATTLVASFAGQAASRNLDASEQFILGGPASVRAYDASAAAGAHGVQATVELRQLLAAGDYGLVQGAVFVDSGRVRIYRDTFAGSGANAGTLSGAGVGLHWTGPAGWRGSVSVATRIGSTPAIVRPSSSTRAWLSVQTDF